VRTADLTGFHCRRSDPDCACRPASGEVATATAWPDDEISLIERETLKMDSFEKVGYICLGLVAVCYVVAMFVGMVAAFPVGLIGLVAIVGIGALLIKVIKERRANAEDDHYSKTVDK